MTKLRVSFVFVFCVLLTLAVAHADNAVDQVTDAYVSFLSDDGQVQFSSPWEYYGFSSPFAYNNFVSSLALFDGDPLYDMESFLDAFALDVSPSDASVIYQVNYSDGPVVLAAGDITMTLGGLTTVGSTNGTMTISVQGSPTKTATFTNGTVTSVYSPGGTTAPQVTGVNFDTMAAASPWTQANVNSVVNALTSSANGQLYQIIRDGLSYSGSYLANNGSVLNGSNMTLSSMLALGLQGLNHNMGINNQNYWYYDSTGQIVALSGQTFTLGELMRRQSYTLSHGFYDIYQSLNGSGNNYSYAPGGTYTVESNVPYKAGDLLRRIQGVLAMGFSDVWTSVNGDLVGTFGNSYTAQLFEFGDDESVLSKSETEEEYSNILEAIVAMYSGLQRPLSQLQAVLANDDELELRQQTEPEVDAVIDGFTGEGQGAPSVDQIGEMAGVSGQMGDLFNSGVTPSDMFNAATSGDSYSFFTQEVADALDTTGAVSTYFADDHLGDFSDYELTEDGFYVLRDQSFFDLWQYLGRSDK